MAQRFLAADMLCQKYAMRMDTALMQRGSRAYYFFACNDKHGNSYGSEVDTTLFFGVVRMRPTGCRSTRRAQVWVWRLREEIAGVRGVMPEGGHAQRRRRGGAGRSAALAAVRNPEAAFMPERIGRGRSPFPTLPILPAGTEYFFRDVLLQTVRIDGQGTHFVRSARYRCASNLRSRSKSRRVTTVSMRRMRSASRSRVSFSPRSAAPREDV